MLDVAKMSLDHLLHARVQPDAARVDRTGVYPAETMGILGAAGVFAHHTGPDPDMGAALDASARISAACLTTGFACWCQSALALYLDRSPNRALARRLGPDVAAGRLLGGTGLSNPMKSFSDIEPLALTGRPVAGGYTVQGRLPWVSHIAPGHLFAVVFAVKGQAPVMAVLSADAPGVTLHAPTRFIALDGTATHTVTLRDVHIPDADVIADSAPGFIPTIRQSFVALQLGLGLGLVRGALDAMGRDTRGRALAQHVTPGPEALDQRLIAVQDRAKALLPQLADPGQGAFHRMLRLRRDVALLALDTTRAEAIQAGARGYIPGAPSERRGREAAFVAILTPSIKHIGAELARA